MSLEFYYHPLASYCWKVSIALYENGTPFEPRLVDLMNDRERAEFLKLTPLGKFPCIHDRARGELIVESTIIIEYLEDHYPGPTALIPRERDAARRTRFWDRFFDLYVHHPMQAIVADRLRPDARRDAYGVEERAKADLENAYRILDVELRDKTWAAGAEFTMADCAAAPALYYANRVAPLGAAHDVTLAYLGRLLARPSFARVIAEAEPYFAMFPE